MPQTAPGELTKERLHELLDDRGVPAGVIELIARELRVGYKARRLLAALQATVNKVPRELLMESTRRAGRTTRG